MGRILNDLFKDRVFLLTGLVFIISRILILRYLMYIHVYPDSSLFYEMSRGIYNLSLTEYLNDLNGRQLPLYPMLMTLSFLLGLDLKHAIWINLLPNILGFIVIYLLSLKMENRVYRYLFLILYIFSPTIIYTLTIMCENLFIPLFLLTFYVLTDWVSQNQSIYPLKIDKRVICLLFVFILTILTKITGLLFLIVFLELLVISYIPRLDRHIDYKIGVLLLLIILLGLLAYWYHPVHIHPDQLGQNLVNNLFYIIFGSYMTFWFIDWKGVTEGILSGRIDTKTVSGLTIITGYLLISLSSSHARYLDPLLPIVIFSGLKDLSEQDWSRKGLDRDGTAVNNLRKICVFGLTLSIILLFFFRFNDDFAFYPGIFPIVFFYSHSPAFAQMLSVIYLLPLLAVVLNKEPDGAILTVGSFVFFMVIVTIYYSTLVNSQTVCDKLDQLVSCQPPQQKIVFVGEGRWIRDCYLYLRNLHYTQILRENCTSRDICIYDKPRAYDVEVFNRYDNSSLYVRYPLASPVFNSSCGEWFNKWFGVINISR